MSHRSPLLPGRLAPIISSAVPRSSVSAIKNGFSPAIRKAAYRFLFLLCVVVGFAVGSLRVWPEISRPSRARFKICFQRSAPESFIFGLADLDSQPSKLSLRSPARLVTRVGRRNLENSSSPAGWGNPIGANEEGAGEFWHMGQIGPWSLLGMSEGPETLFYDYFALGAVYVLGKTYWGQVSCGGGYIVPDVLGGFGCGPTSDMTMFGPWLVRVCVGWFWFRDGFDSARFAGSSIKEDPSDMD